MCLSKEEELDLKNRIKRLYIKIGVLAHIKGILQKLDMDDCNPVFMPVDKGSHLHNGESETYETKKAYQELTGSLIYAAMSTGYITQFLSQSNKNLTSEIGMM